VLSGKDVVGIAETGSGKTLCYALPAIVHINSQELLQVLLTLKGDGPIVLVLVPTRELALQIYEEVQKFASNSCIKCLPVYGGTDKQEQLKKLQSGMSLYQE
jgi:ATP-dependent RNA helicase DDX5/DBP2